MPSSAKGQVTEGGFKFLVLEQEKNDFLRDKKEGKKMEFKTYLSQIYSSLGSLTG